MKDDKDFSEFKPQPSKEKSYEAPLVALKTCRVELESCDVELVAGCEIHGLTRQEREYLRFWGYIE